MLIMDSRSISSDKAVTMLNPHGLEAPATLYLIIAIVCLVVALRFLRRALAPIGPLLQAIAATAIIALSVGAALVLLTAALLSGR
jgi:hypothetical protein